MAADVTFHDLYQKSDDELKSYLMSSNINDPDLGVICTAFFNLRMICKLILVKFYCIKQRVYQIKNFLMRKKDNNLEKGMPIKTQSGGILTQSNATDNNSATHLNKTPSPTAASTSSFRSFPSTDSNMTNSQNKVNVSSSKALPITTSATANSNDNGTYSKQQQQQRKSESELNTFKNFNANISNSKNLLITSNAFFSTSPENKNVTKPQLLSNNQHFNNSAQNVKSCTFSPITQIKSKSNFF